MNKQYSDDHIQYTDEQGNLLAEIDFLAFLGRPPFSKYQLFAFGAGIEPAHV